LDTVSVRYIVDDVEDSIEFYTKQLDFEVLMNPAPGFAMLQRGGLRLLLNSPGQGGAGQSLPDGSKPQAGGWNRFQLEVEDLEATVAELRRHGASFLNEIVTGQGGKQILLSDPAGNLVELFQRAEQ
jgi:catechol 2,3-dioxygenase-like lactoylglutathione lyase family enzyme